MLADWRILARRRAGPTPAAGQVVPLPLPPVPIPGAASAAATGKWEKWGKEIGRRLADPGATSLSLVRYRTNDYSVPVAYGYRDVLGSVVIFTVIPAKAGIQRPLAANAYLPATGFWVPAFAGMTETDARRPIFLN